MSSVIKFLRVFTENPRINKHIKKYTNTFFVLDCFKSSFRPNGGIFKPFMQKSYGT